MTDLFMGIEEVDEWDIKILLMGGKLEEALELLESEVTNGLEIVQALARNVTCCFCERTVPRFRCYESHYSLQPSAFECVSCENAHEIASMEGTGEDEAAWEKFYDWQAESRGHGI